MLDTLAPAGLGGGAGHGTSGEWGLDTQEEGGAGTRLTPTL